MISISLNSLAALDNFLKVLILAIRVQMEDETLDEEIIKASRVWFAGSKKFTDEYGIDYAKFTSVFQVIRKPPSVPNYNVLLNFVKGSKLEHFGDISSDLEVPRDRLAMFKNINSCVITENENALGRIVANINMFGDARISRIFVSETNFDQRSHRNELDTFCKKVFKKPLVDLKPEDLANLRKTNPELNKKYNDLRTKVGKILKEAMRSFVRSSGKTYVPVSDMKRYLAKQDIDNRIPDFKGFVDEDNNLYNELGVKLTATVTGRIELNPKYDAKTDKVYVFKHYPLIGDGNPQRIYTVNYKTEKLTKRFDIVEKLTDDITPLRKKWLKDIGGDITDKKTMAALVVELIYLTSGRIGSKTGASGISALMVKEFSDKAAGHFTLTYQGKSGVKQQHKIKTDTKATKFLLSVVRKFAEGKKPKDWLIANARGTIIGSTAIKNYLMSLGAPEGTTVHKFRHVRGTSIAKQIMDKSPFNGKTNLKESEVNKWFMKAMEEVGAELGHVSGDKVTATTALINYIDPRAVEDWFKAIGVRPNATVEKIIAKMKDQTE